ncbi:hypothetical protein MmiEs2_09810 [Methanimicrococcus stummii]|uniref:Uncharacterized protein n=1 Tax=Methanimicrococcus stummii TaxID=3028294 RepID=A0AA96ZZ27_9EURY|nr:hypothetical protein [Methanimicrococcus sp. Es2]WNY28777.1 hypothetical protein MmiEs2_09810 [Methanimicrococcus sp. Es2]
MQTEEIRILERNELISAVVEKHERLIAEYQAEYDALTTTSTALDTEIEDLKKRIAENEEKTEVDDEKKHHYGRDAEIELEKLNLKPMDNDKIKAGIAALTSSKISDSAEERKTVYDALRTDISGAEGGDKSALLAKVDAAYQAYTEEHTLKETTDADKELLSQKQGEVTENRRADWLFKRIDSHKESLEYWKGMK